MDRALLNIITLIVVGFILGWVVEFAWDFLYWRRRMSAHTDTHQHEDDLQIAGGDRLHNTHPASDSDVELLRVSIAQRDKALAAARHQATTQTEDLVGTRQRIRDQENAIAQLNEQIAVHQSEVERLRDSQPGDQGVGRSQEIAALEARIAEYDGLRARLEADAGDSEAEVERLSALLVEANAELDDLRLRDQDRLIIEETEYVHGDDLSDIKGIGDVYAQKLEDAGFHTFRHLADSNQTDLKEVLHIPDWRTPDLQGWINQAREFSEAKEREEE